MSLSMKQAKSNCKKQSPKVTSQVSIRELLYSNLNKEKSKLKQNLFLSIRKPEQKKRVSTQKTNPQSQTQPSLGTQNIVSKVETNMKPNQSKSLVSQFIHDAARLKEYQKQR